MMSFSPLKSTSVPKENPWIKGEFENLTGVTTRESFFAVRLPALVLGSYNHDPIVPCKLGRVSRFSCINSRVNH